MLSAFAATDTLVRDTFAEASEVLGYDLWQLVSEGPLESLNATERQQPAMLAAGVATWRLWLKSGGAPPQRVSGHSLGEFTALVAAQALKFSDAVELVRYRGELMQQAVPAGQGAIAAVLGLDDEGVRVACEVAAENEVVEPVNFNAPGQVVIAGHAAAVGRAILACKERGAKRAVLLPMSVPAHSSLMRPAAQLFGQHLASVDIAVPRIPFWSPVDAGQHASTVELKALLQRQLASPVRWTQLIRALAADHNVTRFVECGPGKVLTSLNRRIERRDDIECIALEDPASLALALANQGVHS
jgi:[acyl-carrier-protein] S-malonyltransferase